MGNFKKTDVTISKFIKYFVYKLEEDVEVVVSRKFARVYNEKTEECDGKAYIKRRYTLYHNGNFEGQYKKQIDLLQALIKLRDEVDSKIAGLSERNVKFKEGENDD